MKCPENNSTKTSLLFAVFALTVTANCSADELADIYADISNGKATTATAYVDSIHQWGAWDLDIEPAAGGLQQASTQALNARDSRASVRTNSFSALVRPAALS